MAAAPTTQCRARPSCASYTRWPPPFYGSCACSSVYCWWDASGTCRDIHQAEGCEQGDAFSLGQHDGLERAAAELQAGEELLAYLDDLYVITGSRRAREGLDLVASRVQEHCGIASNVGKRRVYNAGHGAPPPGVHELGDEVWRGNRPSGERGFTALGVPFGHPDYIREWGRRRVRHEQAFLDHLPHLPDLQCAWLLLLLCQHEGQPRSTQHPARRGAALCRDARPRNLRNCLGEEADPLASPAWAIATLPAVLGGLGLQSAVRTAPAAYWGAWADAAPTWPGPARTRWHAVALGTRPCVRHRLRPICYGTRVGAIAQLGLPSLTTCLRLALQGKLGPVFHASRTRTNYFRERVLLPTLEPAHRALLLSQSGQQAAAWLTAVPADTATALPPEVMQIALRRRLRLRLPLGPAICGQEGHGCGRRLDAWGDHALACPRTGYLAKWAKLVERAWIAVCREAVGPEGHVVPQQWLMHTSAPGVLASDRRRLDLVVYGASPQGLALCCDATLASPVCHERGRAAPQG